MPQYQIPPTTELARIPSVAELEAKLAALVVVPHQLPTAPREAHKARAAYLEEKEHLTTLLSMAKAIEKNGWHDVPGRPGPEDIRANPARIRGGGPRKTLADWIREFEVCVDRMKKLEPRTENWMQARQRAYTIKQEIKDKAQRLGLPMPELPIIPSLINGPEPQKTMEDWIREFEHCVERMAGLPPGTETWMQTRQRAYQVRVEIRQKAAKLKRPMPDLPAIPRERDEEAA